MNKDSTLQDLLDLELLELQELLDLEAKLYIERKQVLKLIKEKRATLVPPPCWGRDDCSIAILVRCPFRIDCDNK